MTLKDDLKTLDRLTDGEADNLRTAIRQGDLPEDMTLTWAVVVDSWAQMPADVQARYGDPDTISAALGRVAFLTGADADVVETYALPDYEALGQTEDETRLLVKHDLGEDLHAFVEHACDEECGDPTHAHDDTIRCGECGDTAEGLMHNNTWRNVEPLMDDEDDQDVTEGGNPVPTRKPEPLLSEILGEDDDEVTVEVTYKFVVTVPQGYEQGDVIEAVMGYINSVGYALDNPVKIEEV